MVSPDALVEDFSASVDYLGIQPFIDRNRIGVIGICGSGGFSVCAASLDPRAAHSAMKAAASAAEKGACVVAVLHDPNLAFDYCGRAILLKQGKIYASGKTEDALSGENLSAAYSHRCEVFDSPFGKTARFPKFA